MSSRKFAPYGNKRENMARRNPVEQRVEHHPQLRHDTHPDERYDYHSEPRSNYNSDQRFNSAPGSSVPNRDLFPMHTEPQEYGFRGPSSIFYQQPTKFLSKPSTRGNKTWSSGRAHPYGQRGPSFRTFPLHQPLPTFQQYMDEDSPDCEQDFDMPNNSSISGQQNHGAFVQKRDSRVSSIPIDLNSSERSQAAKNPKAIIWTRIRLMIGTVDQVTRWYKMTKHSDLKILYEVAGILETIVSKEHMDLLIIRSESGHVLQGVFYSIDRQLPTISSGTIITATGNMIGSSKMHIFDVNVISRDDFRAVQRLAFLSQRALEETLEIS